jgi:DNA repair protein RecN (Recombination protein N)
VLTHLHISDLAIIDEVELEFGPGLTVLTGETGAGKSILVDALALALGERADSRAIRKDANRCEVTAQFDLAGRADLVDWLAQNDLDDGNECIMRRVVTAEGRSRGYINGRPVPMQTLKDLGEQLVDICGQQSHQSLRHAGIQREIVDHVGGHASKLAAIAKIYAEWQAAEDELTALSAIRDQRQSRQDLLSYQVAELADLGLETGEFARLEQDHLQVASRARIAGGITHALNALYDADTGTAQATLTTAGKDITELGELDPKLMPIAKIISEAEILVIEAADDLRQHLGDLNPDPALQAQLEERIADIHELARKHRAEPDALPELAARLSDELADLAGTDERLAGLQSQTAALREQLSAATTKLTRARRKAANKLAAGISENIQALGMPGGQFDVAIEPLPNGRFTANGADRIEFIASANPGHDLAPLARVASGGELSRISLAVQTVAMSAEQIPTLIFDEVDSGVGGGVAEIVGLKLKDLSQARQVLCVTHLPQVASCGEHHLRVNKITDGSATRTSVNSLTDSERIEEIARMLGGVEITTRTRDHAKEMLTVTGTRKTARKAG